MAFSFRVDKMNLTDGTVVSAPANGMTVFIGPNNSGKSRLLGEIAGHLASYPGPAATSQWLSQMEIEAEGTAEDFLQYLHSVGMVPRVRPGSEPAYPLQSRHVTPMTEMGTPEHMLTACWNSRTYGQIASQLLSTQWTGDRLQDQTSSSQLNRLNPPSHPTQYLRTAPSALAEFSRLIESAFGTPISMNRLDEQGLRLTIGDPELPADADPASYEYWDTYRALPGVADQGDGFRSFINLLLHTLVRPTPVIVIDEPEAFLHPPQARLLGRILAERTPSPCQVFVATHSADFLSGVLEATTKPVALVRLTRTPAGPRANQLDPEDVASILRTPMLRYSNIIAGLFHDGVVLGESAGDCQFYAATIDALKSDDHPSDNLVFLHTSGKHLLADTAARLRQCGIPVAVIADLDLLNNKETLKTALSAAGGDWEKISADFETLDRNMRDEKTVITAAAVKRRILEVLGDPKDGTLLTEKQIDEIRGMIKATSSWANLKKAGLPHLSGSPAYMATRRIFEALADRGIFAVPVGELEKWVPEVAVRKNRWLTYVFENGHHLRPSDDLRRFCERITSYLSTAPERPAPQADSAGNRPQPRGHRPAP
ncbi:ATP-dependent endonuclease [Kitasatospora sp. NPDC058184]|uniref:ATP-dependent nuclease n=1 Tax=Kitasatospora sp. NPDC058184 TaxID=3346370 RepID=UPI0036DC086D